MRVQLISDLHLERYPDFRPAAAPDADLLVLAGDIGSYQAGSRLPDADFGLGHYATTGPAAAWKQVLYIPGNHEFDGLPYADTYARLRATCERLGITWLEREVVTVGGVRFVGSTLWSDFDAYAGREKHLGRQLAAREKAFRAANFYLRKNTTLIADAPALAEEIRALALDAQAWLRDTLKQAHAGTTVVVTHFAPSLRSADPRYGANPGTAGFCNSLDELLPLASVWMHGHLHCPNDYSVTDPASGRTCRVVANPRGYYSKGEQATYRDGWTIEIPAA